MNRRLHQLLTHLAATLDPAREREIAERHQRALRYEPVERPPLITMYPFPPDSPWQPFPHREVFDDPEKMLFNELVSAWGTSIVHRAQVGDDLPATIRANFGTVLVASMFGAPVEQHEDNPPWIVHQPGHVISLQQVADTDPADFSKGWIPRATERMQAYHDLLAGFPGLRERVQIVLPDLQGPFDNLELICGSETFLHLATEPEAVDAALANMATTQIGLFRHFSQWTTERDAGCCHQHGFPLAGTILLRNDSCIMVSPEMYRRQMAGHDERVLRECGGGGIHSCGNISHLVDEFPKLPSLRSLDLGQPELNDVDAIYANAAQRKVPLIRVAASAAELASGRILERFPTGATLLYRASSFDDAKGVVKQLNNARKHLT
jgi:hypothetical protein